MVETTLSVISPSALIGLRGNVAEFAVLQEVVGVSPPVQPNTVVSAEGLDVLWLGPDEWLLVSSRHKPRSLMSRIEKALAGMHHAAVDLTEGRVILDLAGPGARDVLAQGCSLDLHPGVFGPGTCAQTGLARAAIILQQRDERPCYRIFVRGSEAPYIKAWLKDAMS